jgi:hypothetical protein
MNFAQFGRMLIMSMSALAIAGCATEKIDWTARVGHYTYSQAVKDFGPPDNSSKLSDGSTVAEWMTQRSQTVVNAKPVVMPSNPGSGQSFVPAAPTTYYPGRYLQLAFGADGTLVAEKEYSK